MPTVLLVEPRKHKIALLSLMKFATYYESKGWRVLYVEGTQFFGLPKKVDKIIVSGVFTFDVPKLIEVTNYYASKYQLDKKDVHVGGVCVSLMPGYIKEQCPNATIHIGLCELVDQLKPSYWLYPKIDYSLGYSTRGCIRKCGFCAVHRIEPEYIEIENWENMLNMKKPRILMLDNNFTACSDEHFEKVCRRLEYFGKTVDFNQSVDCRLFTEFHAKQFARVKLECLRFSYDSKSVKKDVVKNAVDIARKYGHKDIRFDVLYNWKDTPEDFYNRLDFLNELDCKAFPMKFVPLDKLDRNHVGDKWTKERLIAFNKVFGTGFSNGMVGNGTGSRDTFQKTFGKTPEEFLEKLDLVYVNKKGMIDKYQDTFEKWM